MNACITSEPSKNGHRLLLPRIPRARRVSTVLVPIGRYKKNRCASVTPSDSIEKGDKPFLRYVAVVIISQSLFQSDAHGPTGIVIPANEAAAHIGEYAMVEGVVAKVFTSKGGNTFLNVGATYPNQTFTGWIPSASAVNKSPILSGIEGKHVKITGRIEMYKGKPEIRINAASQLEVE